MSESEKDRLNRLAMEQAMCRRADMLLLAECMKVPSGLFSGDSNYASARIDASVYGASPISAADVRGAMEQARSTLKDVPDSSGTAYLVMPPKMHQQLVQLSNPYPEDSRSKVLFAHQMDYMPMMSRRVILTSFGDGGSCIPRKPAYKPRPAVAEVPPATSGQWAVLFGVGVLILLMMLSAVGSL